MSSTDDKAEQVAHAAETTSHGAESWFGRLKSVLGFKSSASIRDNIEDAL
jgi:hypothetical protein